MNISKPIISLVLFSVLISACSSKQEKMLAEIEALEQGDSSLRIEDVDKLMKIYGEFATLFPEHERSETFLHRALKHHYHIGETDLSEKESRQYLSAYPNGKNRRQTQWVLGNISSKYKKDPSEALRWYSRAGFENANPTELQDLYATYELWQSNKRTHDSASWYAYQAAAGYANLEDPLKAIQLCDTVITYYPKSSFAPKALFLKAFTAENQLADITSARASYEQLVQAYPDDELSKQAELILKDNLLGISADEMLSRILKNKS